MLLTPLAAAQARAFIGTSAWSKESWKGHFHPIGLPERATLRYTAQRLATVEANTTFYGLRRPSDFLGWAERTPADFVMAVKGHRAVTHDHRLRDPERHLAEFFTSGVLLLGDKLGPLLWQIERTQPFEPDIIARFLAALPHTVSQARELVERTLGPVADVLPDGNRRIQHAFEVRHPSFATPAFVELLKRHDVAAVFGPAPHRTAIDALTSDFVYVRLHASAEVFPDGYDDATLTRWAGTIEGWLDGSGCPDGHPRGVFAYFANRAPSGWHPPFDAIRLQSLLGGRGGAESSIPATLW